MAIITDEQRANLAKNPRFQDLAKETTITNLDFAPLAEQTFGIRAQEIKF